MTENKATENERVETPQTYVCPPWMISLFDNNLRWSERDKRRILSGLLTPGQAALDLGCGRGVFTLDLARLAGAAGQVTAVDLQAEMLAMTAERLQKADLPARVELLQAGEDSLHLGERRFDLALCVWMLHEVPDQTAFLQQVWDALNPGGRFFLIEPRIHVSPRRYRQELALILQLGFRRLEKRRARFSWAVVFGK